MEAEHEQSPTPTAPPPLLHHHHPHASQGHLGVTPVQCAHAVPTSAAPHEGHAEEWRWCGAGRGGAGGAQCSITCGREGLVLTYNTQAGAPHPVPCPHCATPPLCSLPAPSLSPAGAVEPAESAASTVLSRSMLDLSRPQQQPEECGAAGRSMTFSGSLDRHTPRQQQQQRPYGRRCKSTAHIVLQNNDATRAAPRPHEFHATTAAPAATPTSATFTTTAPPNEARGRARHRTAPQPSPHGGAEAGGWQRVAATTTTTTSLCPCHLHHHHHHPWPPLCPLMSSHNPYHPCLHPHTFHPCPHHHPATPNPSLLAPCCHPHAPAAPGPAPPEGVGRAASRSPTVRTFNSHCHYQDVASPPPSPRLAVRRRASASPRGSPSPERRGVQAEDVSPQGAPQLPRRVPRMGAAAAAAAATSASSAAPPPTQVCWGAAEVWAYLPFTPSTFTLIISLSCHPCK